MQHHFFTFFFGGGGGGVVYKLGKSFSRYVLAWLDLKNVLHEKSAERLEAW